MGCGRKIVQYAPRMQRFREFLTLALIVLLPFHAFLVTVATRVIQGPGHAPMGVLAAWKEGVLVAILLVGVVEILLRFRSDDSGIVVAGKTWKADVIDLLIILLIGISVVLYLMGLPPTLREFTLGFKYDFVPLVVFLILRRLPWSEDFLQHVIKTLLWVGVAIAGYGILTFILPGRFFTILGYSDAHSLYIPTGPLAAFQHIGGGGGVRRIQSVMSGPNQLGLWLLIPWSIALVGIQRKPDSRLKTQDSRRMSYVLCLVSIGAALLLSFSRSAWIASFVILCVALLPKLQRKDLRDLSLLLVGGAALFAVATSLWMPNVFLRLSSNRGHWERPVQAMQVIKAHPMGLGIGTAGPASNRTHEACVFLEADDDPTWAQTTPNLCVFLGDKQVQPKDHECSCPLLPENWYLQFGVELGVAGMVLFIAVIILLLLRIRPDSGLKTQDPKLTSYVLRLTSFHILLGISIAALFLHSWEDAAVAYTAWILIALSFSLQRFRSS